MGNKNGFDSCDYNCSIQNISIPENILPVPVINIVAANETVNCTMMEGLSEDSEECRNYLAGRNAMIQIG